MPFKLESVHLEEIKVIVPDVFTDHRGYFMESYRQDVFSELGIPYDFKQDNHSLSKRGVIRGLHFQWDAPLGKLMRVTRGTVFLVAVDIRRDSPTVGQWFGLEVSAENKKQVWAPPYFARGFCVLSEEAELQYKCTAIYNKHGEGGIRFDDPDIGIEWCTDDPIVSPKDAEAQSLAEWLESEPAKRFVYQSGD